MVDMKHVAKLGAVAALALGLSGCAQIREHCTASEENEAACIAIGVGLAAGALYLIHEDNDTPIVLTNYSERNEGSSVDAHVPAGDGVGKKAD